MTGWKWYLVLMLFIFTKHATSFSNPDVSGFRCIDTVAGESVEIDVTDGDGGFVFVNDCGFKAITGNTATIIYLETDCTPYITVGQSFEVYLLQSNVGTAMLGDKLFTATCDFKVSTVVTRAVTVDMKTATDSVSMTQISVDAATMLIVRQSDVNFVVTTSYVGEPVRLRIELDPQYTRTAIGFNDGFDIRATECEVFAVDGGGVAVGPVVQIQSSGCAVPSYSSIFGTIEKQARGILFKDFNMFRTAETMPGVQTKFKCTLEVCLDDCMSDLLPDCSDALKPWGRKRKKRSNHGNIAVIEIQTAVMIYDRESDIPRNDDQYVSVVLVSCLICAFLGVLCTVVLCEWKRRRSLLTCDQGTPTHSNMDAPDTTYKDRY